MMGPTMKRLYFRVPTIASATSLVEALQADQVPDSAIYLIGKDHHRLQMAHLHEAGILQTTSLLYALQRGVAVGSLAGLLAGLIAFLFPPGELELSWGVILALGLLGAAFGAWGSTLVGITVPNPVVAQCKQAIEAGELLMLIDIPSEREQDITALVKKQHPEARIEGFNLQPRRKSAS